VLIAIVTNAVHPYLSFSSSSDDDDRCDCHSDWNARIPVVAGVAVVVVADVDLDDTFFSFSSFLRLWLVSVCHPYC